MFIIGGISVVTMVVHLGKRDIEVILKRYFIKVRNDSGKV